MARQLLVLAATGVLVHGCLIPQDDPVLPNLPPKRNTSPELLLDTAAPAQRNRILSLAPTCLPRDRPFQIAVVDPDLGDTIRSRWFVDHDPQFTTIAVNGSSLPRPTTPERGILKPLEQLYSGGSLLLVKGAHYVTVVVADREFLSEGIDLMINEFDLPDGGKISDTSKTARYTWEVTTDLTPCQ